MDLTDGPSEQELPANQPNAGGGIRTRTGIALRCLSPNPAFSLVLFGDHERSIMVTFALQNKAKHGEGGGRSWSLAICRFSWSPCIVVRQSCGSGAPAGRAWKRQRPRGRRPARAFCSHNRQPRVSSLATRKASAGEAG